MGVPQFFHWLVTHFDKKILKERTLSRTEYLYLDFNCGIHPAVKQPHLTELPEMYQAVCEYLDTIIYEVKPSKLVYIAIDGVAPNAKMKQQRSRRFKAIQEKREKDVIDRKHRRWKESAIDYNMISPGTQFMKELTLALKTHIKTLEKKYPSLQFILDDASHPGEGEHKITHHIRTTLLPKHKHQPPKITIYGLDSDLIFLTLLHYQPEMYLFREQLFFGRKPPKQNNKNRNSSQSSEEPEIEPVEEDLGLEPKFTYLDVGALRKIILVMMDPRVNIEDVRSSGLLKMKNFIPSTTSIILSNINNSEWNLGSDLMEKRLIIDYVASSFILGNDFLPHLPSLKIKEGGLNRVIECYKEVQQDHLGQFLVESSKFNKSNKTNNNNMMPNKSNSNFEATRFNKTFLISLLKKLQTYEEEDLLHHEKESQIRQSKFNRNLHYRAEDQYQKDVMIWEYIENQVPDLLKLGYPDWESRYYSYYLGENNPDQIKKMAENYYEGLVWMLRYYQGNQTYQPNNFIHTCPKWDWSYHYRNAPILKDLIKIIESKNDIITKKTFNQQK